MRRGQQGIKHYLSIMDTIIKRHRQQYQKKKKRSKKIEKYRYKIRVML